MSIESDEKQSAAHKRNGRHNCAAYVSFISEYFLLILKIYLAFESKVISLISDKNVADVIILVTDFCSHDTYASRAYKTVIRIFSQLNWIISEIWIGVLWLLLSKPKIFNWLFRIVCLRVCVCVCVFRSYGFIRTPSKWHWNFDLTIFVKRHKEIQLPRTNKHFAIFFNSLWIC